MLEFENKAIKLLETYKYNNKNDMYKHIEIMLKKGYTARDIYEDPDCYMVEYETNKVIDIDGDYES